MTIADHALRPGRPRDPACDAAILTAALDVFVEEGYLGLSIEGVATRAGVGKASIYRRYASKAELIVEAIRQRTCTTEELPDTGDLRADLTEMLRSLASRLRGDEGKVMIAFMGERLRHPDLADEFERLVVGAKRAHITELVRAAVERGDLPAEADIEIIAESGPALLWHHALHDLPLTDDLADRIVATVLPEYRRRTSARGKPPAPRAHGRHDERSH